MIAIYTVLAVFAGLLFAVQGPTNASLGRASGSLQATSISFFTGTMVLAIILLVTGSTGLGLLPQARFWQLLGGVYGAFGVFVSITVMPILGSALTITSVMLGQLIMGAVTDALGLFGITAAALSVWRYLGIGLVIAGIILIYFGTRSAGSMQGTQSIDRVPLVLLAFVSGVLGSVQSATNSSLSGVIGNIEGSFISFVVGFTSVFIILVISCLVKHERLFTLKKELLRPWMFFGGLYGAGAIFLIIFVIPVLGVALQASALMLGQLGTGIVIDSFGLLRAEKMRINPLRAAGVAVIAAAVLLISFSA